MKSRRKFIAQGTLAAAAFTALKPLNSFAKTPIATALGLTVNDLKVVLIHGGSTSRYADYASQKISSLKKSGNNLLVLAPGEINTPGSENYQIVYRGDIKTGIIKATERDTVHSINDLASYLKNEQKCQLAVCISPFGYKNKEGLDDVTLAEKSVNLDIIIGNHTSNHSPFPVVTCNSKKEEVIIHSAMENGFGLGNIEIEFDKKTSAKRSVAFNNLLKRLPETA